MTRGAEQSAKNALRARDVGVGPFRYLVPRPGFFAFLLFTIVSLTVVSQVYGLVLWVMIPLAANFHRRAVSSVGQVGGKLATIGVVGLTFLVANRILIPPLAALGGRVPLPCALFAEEPLAPASRWTCLFNRHYAIVPLRDKAERLAAVMAERPDGARTIYLDANFPFWDGFSLLPHLSHDDGKKLDIAFAWRRSAGGDGGTKSSASPQPSPLGYGYYEQPRRGEAQPCANVRSLLRWDLPWLQTWLAGYAIDAERTRAQVVWLLSDGRGGHIKRIFIEPHLKVRLGLDDSRVRFQGCQAARHDDHFHVEM